MHDISDGKSLMVLDDDDTKTLASKSATGMGFYIAKSDEGYLVVLLDGTAMPLYKHQKYYCIEDFDQGKPLPSTRLKSPPISKLVSFENRNTAIAALIGASISPAYIGSIGAFPLVSSVPVATGTTLVRYLSTKNDPRYVGGKLSAGTYATSLIDSAHADTGFGAVGRYALPIPLPASYVIEYTLQAPATIDVGTVAPNFGQAGGGVEIRLQNAVSATSNAIPPNASPKLLAF